MIIKKTGDYTGTSDSDLNDAIKNAFAKAGEHKSFEIVETSCSQSREYSRCYQVTLSTYDK
jgi:flavin-binding protein dodecin